MSGSGIVSEVFGANVPDTNRPAQKVIVNRADQPQVAFFIPLGPAPAEGEAIEWGAARRREHIAMVTAGAVVEDEMEEAA